MGFREFLEGFLSFRGFKGVLVGVLGDVLGGVLVCVGLGC